MSNRIIFLALALGSLCNAYSQSSDSTDEDKKNHFKTGIQYISNQSYAGRTDSLKLPVIIPYASFETHIGFYVKTSGYCNLSTNKKSFDGISIEPGYEFSKNNWNGSISVIKNFISDSSNLIIAPVKASLEFYLENDNKIVTPSVGAEYIFSDEGNDFIFYAGLAKVMNLTSDDKKLSATLEPAISVSGGTQNFYYSFLKNYANNGHGKSRKNSQSNNSSSVTEGTKEQSEQFAILSTGLELPIDLTRGKFEWKTTPALESPLNLANEGAEGAQKEKPFFYVSSELVYTF
jgi:hypothetical protein